MPCTWSVAWPQLAARSWHAFASCPGLQPLPSVQGKAALGKAKQRKGLGRRKGTNPQDPSPQGTGALSCGLSSAEQDSFLCLQELTGLAGGEEAGAERENSAIGQEGPDSPVSAPCPPREWDQRTEERGKGGAPSCLLTALASALWLPRLFWRWHEAGSKGLRQSPSSIFAVSLESRGSSGHAFWKVLPDFWKDMEPSPSSWIGLPAHTHLLLRLFSLLSLHSLFVARKFCS